MQGERSGTGNAGQPANGTVRKGQKTIALGINGHRYHNRAVICGPLLRTVPVVFGKQPIGARQVKISAPVTGKNPLFHASEGYIPNGGGGGQFLLKVRQRWPPRK